MPLQEGSSQKTISKNIEELMHSWERTGKINGDPIESKKDALNRAKAIAESKAHPKKSKKALTDVAQGIIQQVLARRGEV